MNEKINPGTRAVRAAAAGALISDTFEKSSVLDPTAKEVGWESHRWLRFRNTMGLIRSYLNLFQHSMASSYQPDDMVNALCESNVGIPVHNFRIAWADRKNVSDSATVIAELGAKLEANIVVAEGLPRPLPDFVVRASLKS